MYFLLDSQENYNNYTKNVNFFSLFLSSDERPPRTAATQASPAGTAGNHTDFSYSDDASTDDALNTLLFSFLRQLFHILLCRLASVGEHFIAWLDFSSFLHVYAVFIDSFKAFFSATAFEFRIFIVLVHLLLILVTSVLVLWTLLKVKINFYYTHANRGK